MSRILPTAVTHISRWCLIALLLAMGPARADAQAPNQQATAPTAAPQQAPDAPPLLRRDHPADFTAITRSVLVDVVVQDAKGKPIKGLNASDFQIEEDGVTQKIDSFHAHSADDPAKAAAALAHAKLPANTFTNFEPVTTENSATVILIDATNTPFSAQAYARYEIEKFVKTLTPGTPVAIFLMDNYMHLVQGFTTDPKVLLDAVKSKRDDPRLQPLYLFHSGEIGTTVRMQTMGEGLQDMARYLAGFPGRKNLVWFTGSIPGAGWQAISPDFPQIEDYDEELKATTETLALSRASIYPVDARGLEVDPMFTAAHSGIPSPHVIFNAHVFDHQAMDEMAKATGGRAFYNTNGLSQALREVVDNGSDYYTIAYTPTNKNWDGKYRKIRVQIANGNNSVRIQAREGYYARPPAITEQERANAQRRQMQPRTTAFQVGAMVGSGARNNFDNAMSLGSIPPTEIIFHASVTPGTALAKLDKKAWPKDNYLRQDLRGKPERTYHVLYALRTSSVRFKLGQDGSQHGEVAFVAVLYNDKGEQVNSAMTVSEIALSARQFNGLEAGVIGFKQDIAVPAGGNYFLRFGVHDLFANKVGAFEIPVDEIKLGVAGDGQTLTP